MSIPQEKSKNNGWLWLAVGFFVLLGGVYMISGGFTSLPKLPTFVDSPQNNLVEEQATLEPTVSSVIVNHYRFTANQDGQTPFSLLLAGAQVEYQQYDFGVFVKGINGQMANDNYFWAVYVDGEYATQASDKISLQSGSVVEWRWEEVKATE
ncbi:MAG TPA: DUF4430 domain-containing protein [Candidatus Woesebacteria bacterium]|nr:DUF4430 domain-containing protein [Candidatus Woesebacteria bacterium]